MTEGVRFLFTVNCRDQRLDTGNDDVRVGAGTPGHAAIPPGKAHIRSRAGGTALVQAVLRVAFQMEIHPGGALDGVGHSIQTTIAHRSDHLALTVQVQGDRGFRRTGGERGEDKRSER